MKFPKLPDGPSSVGAAAVRALQGHGTPFQTRRGADYVARVKDGFSRVETQGLPQYATAGFYRVDDLAPANFSGNGYRTRFIKSKVAAGVNCDFGQVAFARAEAPVVSTAAFDYPDRLNEPESVSFTKRSVRQVVYIGATTSADQCGELTFWSSMVSAGTADYGARDAIDLHYTGRVTKDGMPDIQVAAFYLADNSRVDSAGRVLLDPVVALFHKRADPEAYLLPMPASISDYPEYEQPVAAVSKSCIYVMVAEKATRLGARDTGMDLRPPVWLMVSTDHGDTWSAYNIRALVGLGDTGFGSLTQWVAARLVSDPPEQGYRDLVAIPLVAGMPVITDTVLHSPTYTRVVSDPPEVTEDLAVNPHDTALLTAYNTPLRQLASMARLTMCEGDKALLTISQFRAIRISDFGATIALVYTAGTQGFGGDIRAMQSVVFAGDGRLVAKYIEGDDTFTRAALDVSFMASSDGGATWVTSAPAGFDTATTNTYFGDLFLESAYRPAEGDVAERHARVLITAFDSTDGVYAVYSTDDYGATWAKRGTVAKPDTFYRMDSVLAGDGGNNFSAITHVGRGRPVDPALPDRYTRTATP